MQNAKLWTIKRLNKADDALVLQYEQLYDKLRDNEEQGGSDEEHEMLSEAIESIEAARGIINDNLDLLSSTEN